MLSATEMKSTAKSLGIDVSVYDLRKKSHKEELTRRIEVCKAYITQQQAQDELEAMMEQQADEVAPEDEPYHDDSQEQCDEPGEIDNPGTSYPYWLRDYDEVNFPEAPELSCEYEVLDGAFTEYLMDEDFTDKGINIVSDKSNFSEVYKPGSIRGVQYLGFGSDDWYATVPRSVRRRAKRFMALLTT